MKILIHIWVSALNANFLVKYVILLMMSACLVFKELTYIIKSVRKFVLKLIILNRDQANA